MSEPHFSRASLPLALGSRLRTSAPVRFLMVQCAHDTFSGIHFDFILFKRREGFYPQRRCSPDNTGDWVFSNPATTGLCTRRHTLKTSGPKVFMFQSCLGLRTNLLQHLANICVQGGRFMGFQDFAGLVGGHSAPVLFPFLDPVCQAVTVA